MKDVLVIVMTFGFFALCIVYVALCDRIVGPDDVDPGPSSTSPGVDVPTAPTLATDVAPAGDSADPVLVASGGASTSIGTSIGTSVADPTEVTR